MHVLLRNGETASDEICICGHLKSEHGSTSHKIDGQSVRQCYAGNCWASKQHCSCTKFRFAGWLTAKSKKHFVQTDISVSKKGATAQKQVLEPHLV